MKIKPRQLKLGELADKLPTMTAQEVFDVCMGHLYTQNGGPSLSGKWVYDGGGRYCVTAAFIKDYQPHFEGLPWPMLVKHKNQSDAHLDMLCRFQSIQRAMYWCGDDYEEQWHKSVASIAAALNLTFDGFEK